jgi:hypothetical protein
MDLYSKLYTSVFVVVTKYVDIECTKHKKHNLDSSPRPFVNDYPTCPVSIIDQLKDQQGRNQTEEMHRRTQTSRQVQGFVTEIRKKDKRKTNIRGMQGIRSEQTGRITTAKGSFERS